jgi:hypothetical protein
MVAYPDRTPFSSSVRLAGNSGITLTSGVVEVNPVSTVQTTLGHPTKDSDL